MGTELIWENYNIIVHVHADIDCSLVFSHYCRHPDKNKVPEAKEKFIQINRAYEVCPSSLFVTF